MLRIYILVAVIGLVGGAVYGAYFYYKDTQARIQTLTENAAKLEIATQTQKILLCKTLRKMQNLLKN